MAYIVMSLNALEGFQMGHFRRLDNLYLVEVVNSADGMHASWTEVLAEAKQYETEEEAVQHIIEVWGLLFSGETMAVISVNQQAIIRSLEKKHHIKDHNYMRRIPV